MTTTATGASKGAPRRSKGTSSTNGKARTLTIKGLRLTIPNAVPVGTFRAAFKDEATNEDVVKFLTCALGEDQMEQIWAIDLDLADGPIADQVNDLLDDLAGKVQKALGLTAGE